MANKIDPSGAELLAGLESGKADKSNVQRGLRFKALGQLLAGLALLGAGAFLFVNNIIVTSGFWSLFGHSAFGLTLIPVFVGVVWLFVNRRSFWGWLLFAGGAMIILLGVIAELHVFFKPISLYSVLLMIVLMAAGVGLIIRSYGTKGLIQDEGTR